jgi:glycosyltransferase involved in cell wall biosynthesis
MMMEERPENQIISVKKTSIPKVSIGMPVYNGEKYMRQAIDSVLAQTYTDFELVISNNNSTDGTEAICKEYAEKDSRIKYIKQPVNIGAINNFNFLLQHARGTYFVWLCHDDYLDASFLEVIVQYLDEHADVALCVSDCKDVKDGVVVKTKTHDDIRDSEDWTLARRLFFTWKHRHVLALYGIYRLNIMQTNSIYLRPGLKGIVYGVEHSVLAKVAIQGRIVALPKLLKYERKHPQSLGVSEPILLRPLLVLLNVVYTSVKYQALVAFFSNLTLRQKIGIFGKMFFCTVPIIFYYSVEWIPRRSYRWLFNRSFFQPVRRRIRAIL